MMMKKIGYIYALIDPFSGMVKYIGQACNLRKRYRQHISNVKAKTHKEKWIAKLKAKGVLPAMKILAMSPVEELNVLEIALIKHYSSFCKLTNGTEGGDGTRGLKRDTRIPLKKARLSVIKPVYQYELNGAFVREWESVTAAAENYKVSRAAIGDAALNKSQQSCGYQWRYEFMPNIAAMAKVKFKKVPVIQYALDGQFVKEWESASKAAEQFNTDRKTITQACQNEGKSCGFKWKYKNAA